MSKVYVEKWKTKKTGKKHKFYVVRNEKGYILEKRPVRYSNLTLSQIKDIYKENNSLYRDIVRTRDKLTNFTEYSKMFKSSYDNRYKPISSIITKKPSAKYVQYAIEGYYNNRYIAVRSQKIGYEGSFRADNTRHARKEAWQSFIERATADKEGYYNDNAEKLFKPDKLTNVREGFVYYRDVKK